MTKKKETTETTETIPELSHDSVITTVDNTSDFFSGMEMLTTIQLKKAGEGIRGEYLGVGDPLIIEEKDGSHEVNTHKIKLMSGLIIRLMGSSIMDRELSNVRMGEDVAILRGNTEKGGKGQITYYQIARIAK